MAEPREIAVDSVEIVTPEGSVSGHLGRRVGARYRTGFRRKLGHRTILPRVAFWAQSAMNRGGGL
jgi:hypothetical protein